MDFILRDIRFLQYGFEVLFLVLSSCFDTLIQSHLVPVVCYSKCLSAVSFRCFHKVIHFIYCITKRCFAMGVKLLITMTFRNRRPDIMHIQTVVGIVFRHRTLLSLLFILYHILLCWSIARLGMAFLSTAIGQLLVTHAEVAAMKSFGRRRTSLAHCDAF